MIKRALSEGGAEKLSSKFAPEGLRCAIAIPLTVDGESEQPLRVGASANDQDMIRLSGARRL